jgi:hypothetical protein
VTDLGKCVTMQTVYVIKFVLNSIFIVIVLVLMCHCNKKMQSD